MMSALGIAGDVDAEAHAEFLVAYAATVRGELEQSATPLAVTTHPDLLHCEIAATLAEAAAWMLLADIGRGTELMAEAGREFGRLGLGFGHLLAAAASGPSDLPRDTEIRALHGLTVPHHGRLAEPPPGMDDLLQQAQMLLALVATYTGPPTGPLLDICLSSPHRIGTNEIGVLGLAVHHYWTAAESMLHQQPDGVLRDHVVPLLERRTDMQRAATVNKWVWQHGAPPMAPLDLEAVAVIALTMQHCGPGDTLQAMDEQAGAMSPVAIAHAQIGTALGEIHP